MPAFLCLAFMVWLGETNGNEAIKTCTSNAVCIACFCERSENEVNYKDISALSNYEGKNTNLNIWKKWLLNGLANQTPFNAMHVTGQQQQGCQVQTLHCRGIDNGQGACPSEKLLQALGWDKANPSLIWRCKLVKDGVSSRLIIRMWSFGCSLDQIECGVWRSSW